MTKGKPTEGEGVWQIWKLPGCSCNRRETHRKGEETRKHTMSLACMEAAIVSCMATMSLES